MKVNLPALRAALATLAAHEDLLVAAIKDETQDGRVLMLSSATPQETHDRFVSALYHIVADEFRSPETGGGS